ncbi:MAG TPA: succinyldiaminopimelate transaminase [Acidimicrobiales bacterium]|nr:succinyldiaminopimelate transaminase [Acidimicrobiales bacterium]
MTGRDDAGTQKPFEPPIYPYERLNAAKAKAEAHEGGAVDLSIGTPCDPPPKLVIDALATSNAERGYPPSAGTDALRRAAAGWMERRLGVSVEPSAVAACVGTKEFVATLPQWLKLRRPDRDTILYPALAYPTYEMGAILAGCRAVPVAVDDQWHPDLSSISDDDASRALALWVNSPGNPAGQVDDLRAAAAWGRDRGVPVFSDECYVEFSWAGEPRTILEHGLDGVVAVHSLSKRSNFAGGRVGFYAGDADLVQYLLEVRKHVGMLPAGPMQAAAVAALGDDTHVDEQRDRYLRRLERVREIFEHLGVSAPLPAGSFYLWAPAPGGDAMGLVDRLAADAGALIAPGDIFGPAGEGHVRVAVVQPDDRIELIAQRLQ